MSVSKRLSSYAHPRQQASYPMDYYAKDAGPWGNMYPGDNAKRVLP